jgi:hypothetical protein
MNAGLLMIVAVPIFLIAYKLYRSYISRVLQECDENTTPADGMLVVLSVLVVGLAIKSLVSGRRTAAVAGERLPVTSDT